MMPFIGPQDSSSGDQISYQTDVIREVARNILTKVNNAQANHHSTWNIIQSYLDGDARWSSNTFNVTGGTFHAVQVPVSDAYVYLRAILEPYEKRLRASYQVQESVAQALNELADKIDQAEAKIQQSFQDS